MNFLLDFDGISITCCTVIVLFEGVTTHASSTAVKVFSHKPSGHTMHLVVSTNLTGLVWGTAQRFLVFFLFNFMSTDEKILDCYARSKECRLKDIGLC